VAQLAQTTMRSRLGKRTLDQTFKEVGPMAGRADTDTDTISTGFVADQQLQR
jgi:regulator of protease activity HflC (stomatin/prohibitin superfamily)